MHIHRNARFLRVSPYQGSFFRLQNTAGLTLVGVFMEGTTLTCLETYSDAKKRTMVHTITNLRCDQVQNITYKVQMQGK
jgi:hypothetical protein